MIFHLTSTLRTCNKKTSISNTALPPTLAVWLRQGLASKGMGFRVPGKASNAGDHNMKHTQQKQKQILY
jgi:hypothetical protein